MTPRWAILGLVTLAHGQGGGYVLPWLVLTVVAAAVALTLPRLAPLVQRS